MKRTISLILILLLFAGCTPKPRSLTPGLTRDKHILKTDPADFKARYLQLSCELLKRSFKEENTLISPISVYLALGMTVNGAEGETLQQMEQVLGAQKDELNSKLYSLTEALESDEAEINIANSLWIENSLNEKREFLQRCVDYYDADIYKTEFNDTAIKQINNWVKDETDGMIDKIIDEIDPAAIMYLINALSFEAEWSVPYRNAQIEKDTFFALNGEKQQAEMMSSSESYYLESEKAKGFMKLYEGGDYGFAAILPDDDITSYLNGLDYTELETLFASKESSDVNTKTPKFSYDFDVDMSGIFKSLGMTDAFDTEKSDFSLIAEANAPICINRILHKTHITLDQKGTKAGAVTAVELKCNSAYEPDPKEVILNKPFMYMIVETKSNTPIFIGTVTDIA